MAAAGPMSEVRDTVAGGRRIRIELRDPTEADFDRAEAALRAHAGVIDVVQFPDHLVVAVVETVDDDDLLSLLVGERFRVRSFSQVAGDLSEAFMRLTKDSVS